MITDQPCPHCKKAIPMPEGFLSLIASEPGRGIAWAGFACPHCHKIVYAPTDKVWVKKAIDEHLANPCLHSHCWCQKMRLEP